QAFTKRINVVTASNRRIPTSKSQMPPQACPGRKIPARTLNQSDLEIPIPLNRANLLFQHIVIVFQKLIHKRGTPIDQIDFILSYIDVGKHRFFSGNG
ncbi:hypothetical protein, partial [Burkholderia contaminans]|uniref:hypothetical protein n=1 Tax=Burkholderia contaminans TaxID=488447 RepID=UPI002D7FD760